MCLIGKRLLCKVERPGSVYCSSLLYLNWKIYFTINGALSREDESREHFILIEITLSPKLKWKVHFKTHPAVSLTDTPPILGLTKACLYEVIYTARLDGLARPPYRELRIQAFISECGRALILGNNK